MEIEKLDPRSATVQQAADVLGVARQQIYKWIKNGAPQNDGKKKTVSIPDLYEWRVQLEASSNANESLAEERRLKTQVDRKLKQVELDKETGDVIPLSGVLAEVSDAFRLCRELLLVIPEDLADQFPASMKTKIRDVADEKIRNAMKNLQSQLGKWLDSEQKQSVTKKAKKPRKKTSAKRSIKNRTNVSGKRSAKRSKNRSK